MRLAALLHVRCILNTDPTKYFGCELGAQTVIDEKNERYIVNGAHESGRLRELLDGFIDRFVLCGACKNPETVLKIRNGDILRDCKACGKRTNVDMRHKLTTFILKNPPPKIAKGSKGAGAASGQTVGGDDDDEAGSDDELTRRIAKDAQHIPTAEQRNADQDEDWSVDTSEAAVTARVQQLEGKLNSALVLGEDDDEDDESSPYSQLGAWVQETRDAQGALGPADVYRKAQELGIEKKHKTLQVLFQTLFDADAAEQIEQYGPVLCKMVTTEKHQKAMLGGLERLAGIHYPTLVPNGVPKLLMALYQMDVLEEDVARQWGTHVSKKYVDKEVSKRVRKAAAPFLEWLDQASDDESGEESAAEEGDSDLDDL